YRSVLEGVLDGGLDGARRLLQLGREALARGYGPLEMAAIHQEAVVSVLLRKLGPAEGARFARRAAEVFGEALKPFELPSGSVREPAAILSGVNRELEIR